MATSSNDTIAILRLELKGIEPLIWRRVAIRTSMQLKDVHRVIQAAMGWLDCHLWEFKANERRYSLVIPDDPDWNSRIVDAGNIELSSVLTAGLTEIEYIYDFGDDWEHRITIEKFKASEAGVQYPQFLGGERRCPPEDCGGIPGYSDFLGSLISKQSKKRKAALEWYGAPYDPDDIDERQIVAALDLLSS